MLTASATRDRGESASSEANKSKSRYEVASSEANKSKKRYEVENKKMMNKNKRKRGESGLDSEDSDSEGIEWGDEDNADDYISSEDDDDGSGIGCGGGGGGNRASAKRLRDTVPSKRDRGVGNDDNGGGGVGGGGGGGGGGDGGGIDAFTLGWEPPRYLHPPTTLLSSSSPLPAVGGWFNALLPYVTDASLSSLVASAPVEPLTFSPHAPPMLPFATTKTTTTTSTSTSLSLSSTGAVVPSLLRFKSPSLYYADDDVVVIYGTSSGR
jgi:hypothetical protein